MNNITPIGRTDWRYTNQIFGIKDEDRLAPLYCVGKSGTGKSTLLENMAISDVERGNGVCIIDPHGDLALAILDYVPQNRIKDVIYFNAADTDNPIAFNPLSGIQPKDHNIVTSTLIATFKKTWSDTWGPRLEHILRFSILSLLCYPSATLLDVQPLLTDPIYRNRVLEHVTDTFVRDFWRKEFDKYSPAFRAEAIAPILNKIGVLSASLPLRNIIGQKHRAFDFLDAMNTGKIVLCNLSKGLIGEEVCTLLGSVLLTGIYTAAMKRASVDIGKRKPFYLYVDEMHSFVSGSIADMLSESRKYGLSVFLTHQYIDQISEKIRFAIFGNVGTLISFRVGADDAEVLAKEFHPVFSRDDLVKLPRYSMYLKLMIDGAASKPFSAQALPLKPRVQSFASDIIDYSRKRYGQSITEVENEFSIGKRTSEDVTNSLFGSGMS